MHRYLHRYRPKQILKYINIHIHIELQIYLSLLYLHVNRDIHLPCSMQTYRQTEI